MSDAAGTERPGRVQKPRPAPLLPPQEPQRSASKTAKVRVDDHQTAEAQVGSYGTFDGKGKSQRGRDAGSPSKRMNFLEYMASPHSPIVQVRDHCHQQWVAILVTILLLGFTLYFVLGTSTPPMGESCATPFGTYLGESNGVVAYSNCNRHFFGNNMDHYVRVGLQRVATGTKWRSIEYVRRYWILTRQLVLPAVSTSDKLLEVESVRMMSKTIRDATVPLKRFRNLAKPLAEIPLDGSEGLRDGGRSGGAHVAAQDGTAVEGSRNGRGFTEDGSRVNSNGVPLAEWVLNRQAALLKEGDIIAYASERRNLTHGHAAVVVHVGGPFRRIEDMSPRMQAYLRRNGTGTASLDSSAESDHAAVIALDSLRKEQHDLARPSASATASRKLGTQSGSLLYQIFIAEQNVDNWYWADELTAADAANLEKRSTKSSNESSMFTTAFKVGVPHPASGGGNSTTAHDADSLFVRRTFSRVLLLREYYPSHTYFLEDTFHSRILGWIRPAE